MKNGRVRDVIKEMERKVEEKREKKQGRIRKKSEEEVEGDMGGKIEIIIDEGKCGVGVE